MRGERWTKHEDKRAYPSSPICFTLSGVPHLVTKTISPTSCVSIAVSADEGHHAPQASVPCQLSGFMDALPRIANETAPNIARQMCCTRSKQPSKSTSGYTNI